MYNAASNNDWPYSSFLQSAAGAVCSAEYNKIVSSQATHINLMQSRYCQQSKCHPFNIYFFPYIEHLLAMQYTYVI